MLRGRFLLPRLRRPSGAWGAGRGTGLVRSDDGFTLIELTIATGVMLTALALLGGVLTAGLRGTGLSRERQTATGLANQTMEKIRALTFDTLAAGLNSADLAATAGSSDTNLSTTGCGGSYCFGGEQVAFTSNAAAVDPLNPHTRTTTIGPNTYTIQAYVTYYQNNLTASTYRATAFVTWTSGIQPSVPQKVQVQSIIFTQPNCLSTLTHPRSGPCTPAFTSSAIVDSGTLSMGGTIGGISLAHANLITGRATSDETLEQGWRVTGQSIGPGAALQAVGAAEATIGTVSASSQADNDPDTPNATIYDTHAMPGQSSASSSLSAGSDSITVATTGGESGQTTSTTSACTTTCPAGTSPTPRNCPNLTGYTNENDTDNNTPANPQPCGGSSSTSNATITANANMTTLGTIALAAIGPQLTPTVALTDRQVVPGTGKCASTSGDGCTWSKITRSATDMSAGALPSNLNALLKPVGFTYFVQLQGLTDAVTTESGKSSAAPTATQSAGTVKVYCASAILGDLLCPVTGYVTKTLSSITSPLTTPTLTITDALLGASTTITMSATISPGSTTTSSSCSGTCDRTSAVATSHMPTVSLSYTIVTGGNTRLSLTYSIDPGAITARTSYAAAPTS